MNTIARTIAATTVTITSFIRRSCVVVTVSTARQLDAAIEPATSLEG